MVFFPSKGTFIFEGITGSGKSAQLGLLKKYDVASGRMDFRDSSCFVYGLTKDVRDRIRGFGLVSESLLHSFTNYVKVDESRRLLDFLFVDRFVLSNLVYFLARAESEGVKVDLNRTRDTFLNPFGLDYLVGTKTIFCSCPVEVAMKRTLERDGKSNFDLDLQKRASDIYNRELELYPYEKFVVDSGGELMKTYKDISDIVWREM